ncbi:hypothetical protein AB0F15_00560 [Amycolatopsis sp. NPDC026612]|uniref:hypothetical protein n=1 Tax=Amycolatopsis sp. NPDC026612 TaxID=3155466 RepID=UPI0033FFF1F6
MTEARSGNAVQQAFFGWSHDDNGLTVLAHSFLQREDAQRYHRRLEPHLRLRPVGDNAVPAMALSYFDFGDGTAAVLRRVHTGHSIGRNDSHAFIGPSEVLNVRTALSLGESPLWKDKVSPGYQMPGLSANLFTGGDAAIEELFHRSVQLETELVVVLSRLLDQPTAPLSVIGLRDRDRLPMVWALAAAADLYLRDELRLARLWSFSTYEDRHDASVDRLPEIVFLPEKPSSIAPVHRTIVDLGKEPTASANEAVAAQLIEAYFTGTPYTAVVQARQVAVSASDLVPHDDEPPANGRAVLAADEPVPAEGHQQLEEVRRHRSRSEDAMPSGSGPIAALLRVKTVAEFDAELGRLEIAAQLRHYREQLRAGIDVGVVDAIANFAEFTAGRELLLRLLKVLYGVEFEDMAEPAVRKQAIKFIRNGRSDRLAMILGGTARRNESEPVRSAAFERLAAMGNPVTPTLMHRTERAMRLAHRRRYLSAAVVVAAIALLGFAFLLGYLAGQPQPAQAVPAASQPVAPPETTSASGTSGTLPGLPALPVTGTVNSTPDAGHHLFSFVKVGIRYYPQAKCSSLGNGGWRCEWRSAPQARSGEQAELVAVAVPQTQSSRLAEQVGNNEAAIRGEDWGPDLPLAP